MALLADEKYGSWKFSYFLVKSKGYRLAFWPKIGVFGKTIFPTKARAYCLFVAKISLCRSSINDLLCESITLKL